PQIDLNYTYTEFPEGFSVTRNDQWYPRARALGGSTIHNAMINIIAGTRQDFDGLADTFNDKTWSRNNMQNYFKRLEDNLYLTPLLAPDHGFNGWLKTSSLALDAFIANPNYILGGLPILDLNSLAGDAASGVALISTTTDEHHQRSSVHERLEAVQQTHPNRLHFSLDTLATKILLCNSGSGVSAYGVQIAPGAALPVASNFNGKVNLNVQNVTAKYEVIVSAGVFQSPQLLMLSGIGDEAQLSQFGIETIVNLPGVGANLQDHDEVAVNWRMNGNFAFLNGCKFLSDPNQDPCLAEWYASNHENVYAFPGAIDGVISQSSSSLPAPDILTYYYPAFFPGFFR
ncbi:hypothetical protein H0H93_012655, partial [Arthromyces matolae]